MHTKITVHKSHVHIRSMAQISLLGLIHTSDVHYLIKLLANRDAGN